MQKKMRRNEKNVKKDKDRKKKTLRIIMCACLVLAGCSAADNNVSVIQPESIQGTDPVKSEIETEETEDVGEVYAGAELTEDYALAYYGFLKEYAEDCTEPNAEKARFSLACIDDNEVPELLLMENDCHAAGVKVYTYVQGVVKEIGSFGSFGKMQYAEREGMIFDHYMGQGEKNSNFFKLEDGEVKLINALYSCSEHSDVFIIDEKSVDEGTFQKKWKELYEDYAYILIGYDDGIQIRNAELKTILAEALADAGMF